MEKYLTWLFKTTQNDNLIKFFHKKRKYVGIFLEFCDFELLLQLPILFPRSCLNFIIRKRYFLNRHYILEKTVNMDPINLKSMNLDLKIWNLCTYKLEIENNYWNTAGIYSWWRFITSQKICLINSERRGAKRRNHGLLFAVHMVYHNTIEKRRKLYKFQIYRFQIYFSFFKSIDSKFIGSKYTVSEFIDSD